MADEKHESLFVEVAENAKTLRVPGGCALNTTRVISKLAGRKSRVSVNFAGVTGEDTVGDQIHDMLSSDSIAFHRVKVSPRCLQEALCNFKVESANRKHGRTCHRWRQTLVSWTD